jgi:hypothetical protein
MFALPSLYRQGLAQKIGLYENDIYRLYELERPPVETDDANAHAIRHARAIGRMMSTFGDIQKRIARVDRAKGPNRQ